MLTCGAGPGPQPWPWHGWSTAVPPPLASGNLQQLKQTVGCGRSICLMALTWLPSKLQLGVSSCCSVTGTKTCSYTCCATARQMCEGCPLLGWRCLTNSSHCHPGPASPCWCWEGQAGVLLTPTVSHPLPRMPLPSQKVPACALSLPLLPAQVFSLPSSMQCSVGGERATAPKSYAIKCLLGLPK